MKITYDTVVGYARTLCAKRDIPQDLVLDIAHDAWIEISLKLGGDFEVQNRRAFEQRVAFTAILDAIRKHRRWNGHDAGFRESDQGTAAERAFLAADDWQEPFWLRLFWATHKDLQRDVQKREENPLTIKAVNALLKESRLPLIRQTLRVSCPTFRTILKILQRRFALCYQALHAFRVLQRTFSFFSDNRLYKCRR